MDESGKLIAMIGDEDTVTGFLLAGVGHRTPKLTNFLVVKPDTPILDIEKAFGEFTTDKFAIILINQSIAQDIKQLLTAYNQPSPAVLEIPSKDVRYDPEKDHVMQRVNLLLGAGRT